MIKKNERKCIMSNLIMEKPLFQGFSKDLPIYTVVIHKNEDGVGYWAICDMPNGGASTIGDTICETQRNMYESVSLYLADDYPSIKDFSLVFVMSDE